MYLESLKTVTEKLTIYYDGACPLCLAEIHFLKHHNQRNLLAFVNLLDLDQASAEVNCDLAMKTIHGRLGDKKIITGPSVFQEAYKRTDLKLINYLFSLAWFRFFYGKFYVFFAKYRHQISSLIGPRLLRYAKRKYQ
jgi:predicted DCC family thiol-disulfide oxidoreductase YuxK